MYFQESDILLQDNPEYREYIETLDEFLGKLQPEEKKQLNKDVIVDLTGVPKGVVDFLLENYTKMELLTIKNYIKCPIKLDIVKEIPSVENKIYHEFCDICGQEHAFLAEDIVSRYSFTHIFDSNREEGVLDQSSSIPIETISSLNEISEKISEYVRIAVIQLNYELSEDTFPPKLIDFKATKEKIFNLMRETKKENAKIVCLPELCLCEEWLSDLKKEFSEMIIIAGSYYNKNNQNICKIIDNISNKDICQLKIKPSEFETDQVTEIGMVSGEKLIIYKTVLGSFSVLICRDFGNYIDELKNKVDIIFVPSYNESPNRFEEIAHNCVQNTPLYIIISNASSFGDTSIFGQLDKTHSKKLIQKGCKETIDLPFKLCSIEKDEEGIIIANFNLQFKGIQKPTTIDPEMTKRSVTKIKKILVPKI